MPKLLYRHHQGTYKNIFAKIIKLYLRVWSYHETNVLFYLGSGPVDLNRSAVWENTTGVRPSQPMHVVAYSRTEERERLQTSYNNFHNYKLTMHDRRKGKFA